jgi:hypothetical protein
LIVDVCISKHRLNGVNGNQFTPFPDFDFKAHIQLFMSREGAVQDFRISECAVTNRDDAALERRLLSPDKQYCNVEQAPF